MHDYPENRERVKYLSSLRLKKRIETEPFPIHFHARQETLPHIYHPIVPDREQEYGRFVFRRHQKTRRRFFDACGDR